MSSEDTEGEFRDRLVDVYGSYDRLVSFYFKKETDIVMNVIKNGKENKDGNTSINKNN